MLIRNTSLAILVTLSAGAQYVWASPCQPGAFNFNADTPLISFADQDEDGGIIPVEDGCSLYMDGNSWAETEKTFNITTDTVLTFGFLATGLGESHGIGFTQWDNLPGNQYFMLHGSQGAYGLEAFDYTEEGVYQRFTIPVGQYLTGSGFRMVFVMDQDTRAGATSYFDDIQVVTPVDTPIVSPAPSATPRPSPIATPRPDDSSDDFISTGGQPIRGGLCPQSARDIILSLDSLNIPPAADEMEMTVAGMQRYIDENGIKSLTELLDHLPTPYRTNFSMVEVTRATGQATLEFPRLVLWGPDSRFLINVGTLASDPEYNLLDVAQFHDDTGEWEFSQFDFRGADPVLHSKPEACLSCHGSNNPRPIWGSNLDWPDVFGDNELEGPNPEALSERHLAQLNIIRSGEGGSERFDFLMWDEGQTLRRGGFRLVRNNRFGAELLISNLTMGATTARGGFVRMLNQFPEKYTVLREAILLLGYEQIIPGTLTAEQQESVAEKVQQLGGSGKDINGVLMSLGLDVNETFSISTLADSEEPKLDWSLGGGEMYEQILLQVLNDLVKSDANIQQILEDTSAGDGVFKCPDLADTVKDIVDFKMLHLYDLKGLSRYEVNKVYYAQDAEVIIGPVFEPVSEKLVPYLLDKLADK